MLNCPCGLMWPRTHSGCFEGWGSWGKEMRIWKKQSIGNMVVIWFGYSSPHVPYCPNIYLQTSHKQWGKEIYEHDMFSTCNTLITRGSLGYQVFFLINTWTLQFTHEWLWWQVSFLSQLWVPEMCFERNLLLTISSIVATIYVLWSLGPLSERKQ